MLAVLLRFRPVLRRHRRPLLLGGLLVLVVAALTVLALEVRLVDIWAGNFGA